MKGVVEGVCKLCGKSLSRSYEHTPPKAAFNDTGVLEMRADYVLGLESKPLQYLDEHKGRINQRGAGGFTLCGPCNSKTGSWYASKYSDFSHVLMQSMRDRGSAEGLIARIKFCPLNVLKQIVLMTLTSNPDPFRQLNPDLVEFVENRNCQYLPRRYGIYIALFNLDSSRLSRTSGLVGRADLETGMVYTYSEVAFPPLVNVLTVDSPKPDVRLVKVNWFRHYKFDEVVDHPLSLMKLPVVSPFPGDYRDEEELRATVAEGSEAGLK